MREFEKVRSQGYAIEREESALQATCIGVPILNEQGRAIAALSISGPTHRFRPAQDDSIAAALLRLPARSNGNFGLRATRQ